jgi:hypothetical protein
VDTRAPARQEWRNGENRVNLQAYLRHRRVFETGLWVLFFGINWAANTAVVHADLDRAGLKVAAWEPAAWEGSSGLVMLALIPALLWFDRRFPLARPNLGRHLAAHAAFTLPFSLAHILGMVGLRKLIYAAAGRAYEFGDWPTELVYEYLKDFRSYAGILVIIYLYRFALRRLQGEAEFLSEGREEQEPAPVTDRFLVRKLGRDFLVRVGEIDWVEASGNYVNLYVGRRAYPLRETMTGIEQRLAPHGFVRVHRSAIVNLERVRAILPNETGDATLELEGERQVPVSRRYRRTLRERIEAGP